MSIKFDKFLMLATLLATGSGLTAACNSADKSDQGTAGTGGVVPAGSTGGSAGTTGGGEAGTAAGNGGTAGTTAGEAGTAGTTGGSATAGTATAGEAGTAGTAGGSATGGTVSTCIGDPGTAGAGGIIGTGGTGGDTVTPSCEGLPTDICDPTTESYNRAYAVCTVNEFQLRPLVWEALIGCLNALTVPTAGACDAAYSAAADQCLSTTIARACQNQYAADACDTGFPTDSLAAITACTPNAVTSASCVATLSAYTDSAIYIAASCMDPQGEDYDVTFTGDCPARLKTCLLQ
jgi:hypothetical protein